MFFDHIPELNEIDRWETNKKMNMIYVASSWKNEVYDKLVEYLKDAGFKLYDFKEGGGFHFSSIDKNWKSWGLEEYKRGLNTRQAKDGFNKDFSAIKEADVCIMVMPCGRSAHLEAGYFVGAGKTLIIYIPKECAFEPELMYKMADYIATDFEEIVNILCCM